MAKTYALSSSKLYRLKRDAFPLKTAPLLPNYTDGQLLSEAPKPPKVKDNKNAIIFFRGQIWRKKKSKQIKFGRPSTRSEFEERK